MEKKIKIEIKSRFTGKILFEYEKEDNTIKDTLLKAVSQHTYLRGADLGSANLEGAYLGSANLEGANLRGAYLRGAYLRGVYLGGANLRGADLGSADLGSANLRGANLGCAYLEGANLGCAYLRGADLRGVYLGGADLRGADLGGADLGGADLRGAKNIPYYPLACPSDGEFTGWKKVGNKLIQLLIPADAKRSSATSNKCRCDKAMVVAITDFDGTNPIDSITNTNYAEIAYKVGEMVYPDSFDENRWKECSNGIHFFINKQDAINY